LPEEAAQRIQILEDFPEADRDVILAAAEIVVVPSREEAFGLVILEAWAAKRPVVASDIAAIASVISDGVDGLLVPVGEPAALGAAVSSLLENPATAQRLGLAGRERIPTEFSWEAVVDRWNEELVAVAPTEGRSEPSLKGVT
jgi:glycosyltransferase involved in cell wall biosynthesis